VSRPGDRSHHQWWLIFQKKFLNNPPNPNVWGTQTLSIDAHNIIVDNKTNRSMNWQSDPLSLIEWTVVIKYLLNPHALFWQDIEKHAYEWERCLESCLEMINNANNVFNSISRSVCNEVIKSEQGAEYVASKLT
jgi:hypothetical protein